MKILRDDIKKIGFEKNTIFIVTNDGKKKSMPLHWFPSLKNASQEERNNYILSPYGIHWEQLNEDLSFSGFFTYNKDKIEQEKSEIQKILANLPFINLEELSKEAKISPILMRHYACGVKRPSKKRTQEIKAVLHKIGERLQAIV